MQEAEVRQTSHEPNKLRDLAISQAHVWEGSRYFDDAEKWTHIFWRPEGDFRKKFDQIELSYVVELACGHGRHAEMLASGGKVGRYCGIDVLPSNIEKCRERLSGHGRFEFILGDGVGFGSVDDAQASAIFCYDAMVHFHSEVVLSYLKDASRILKKGGRAVFHHSNYSSNPGGSFGTNPCARAFMSLDLFHHYAAHAGLRVIEAMPLRWTTHANLDGLTLLEKV
jgi:SAM-dependent methyltransferase